VKFLSEIHALKIDLYLHQQGLDTTTPAGNDAGIREFERAMTAGSSCCRLHLLSESSLRGRRRQCHHQKDIPTMRTRADLPFMVFPASPKCIYECSWNRTVHNGCA
jgi:hypothetical protein